MQIIDIIGSLLMALSLEAGDGEKKAEAKETFEALDADGDRKLSRAEFVAHRKGEQAIKAAKIFKKMDADGDGSLSPEEFKELAKRRDEKKQEKG
jgi:Ca2+-binding EF-hand superfamily protein